MTEKLKPCPIPKCGELEYITESVGGVCCGRCLFQTTRDNWQVIPRSSDEAKRIADEVGNHYHLGLWSTNELIIKYSRLADEIRSLASLADAGECEKCKTLDRDIDAVEQELNRRWPDGYPPAMDPPQNICGTCDSALVETCPSCADSRTDGPGHNPE